MHEIVPQIKKFKKQTHYSDIIHFIHLYAHSLAKLPKHTLTHSIFPISQIPILTFHTFFCPFPLSPIIFPHSPTFSKFLQLSHSYHIFYFFPTFSHFFSHFIHLFHFLNFLSLFPLSPHFPHFSHFYHFSKPFHTFKIFHFPMVPNSPTFTIFPLFH